MSGPRPVTAARLAVLLTTALVTVVVAGVYLLVHAAVGRVAGAAVATAAATAAAALAALPAHVLARRPAARLTAGTPPVAHGVFTELAALPPASTGVPDLARAVEVVGRGLGADVCTLTVRRPGLRDRAYTWARTGGEPPQAHVEIPLRHGGEHVGTLALDRVTAGGTPAERQELLEAIASQLGVVLQAVRSGIELERQLRAALAHAAEIATARRRAVAETDAERRRIERDLHDGAQHHLVTLSLALGLVEHELTTGRSEQARAGLDRIGAQIDTVEELLARTAAGVTSPALAERGLVAALHEEFDRGDPAVTLDLPSPAAARFPADIEAAVYFCCLEAVGNARKHAPGAAVRVRVAADGDRLRFAVQDDGPGWALAAGSASPGRGMGNVAARIAAVGGEVGVRSAPGAGTTVEGAVPLPGAAPDRPASGPLPPPGLLVQVRVAVRAARDLFHGTPQAEPLRRLARSLDEPLRIAVTGPSAAASALAAALAGGPAQTETPAVRFVPAGGHEPDGPEGLVPDAYVVLLGGSATEDDALGAGLLGTLRPSQAIGVLIGPDAGADGPGTAARRRCQAVVAAPAALPAAVPAAAGAPRAAAAAGAAPDDGGLARVRELVATRLVARAAALKARTALAALDALLRAAPSRVNNRRLLYELDEIRSGAHELAELDLLDALCSGELRVPDEEHRAAERLLGTAGTQVAARLGCAPGAGAAALADAARQQLARWQAIAVHPASTAASRTLAQLIVRTCERLLAEAAASR